MLTRKRKEYLRNYRKQHREQQAVYYQRWYKKHGRKYKTAYAEIIMLYDKKHPDRKHARQAIGDAIRRGKLIKPTSCIICDKERYLNAHHEDYTKKLDVLWVCVPCHKKIHLGTIVL